MKKTILFAGLLLVAAMFVGCTSDNSPMSSTTKLWPAAQVSRNADGIEKESWGYIDAKGQFQIQPSYEQAFNFSCGYALVRVSGGRAFFIDEKNQMPSMPESERIGTYFYYDHVRYQTSSYLWGILNKNFETVIQPAYNDLGDVTDAGLVYFRRSQGDKYGYLNLNGEVVIPANFDAAYDFEAGYAVVEMGSSQGIIDKKGNYAVSLQNRYFLQNLGAERFGIWDKENNKLGMMDAKGNIIVQPMYEYSSGYGFTDADLIAVAQDKDHWGYMDKNGKVVIPMQFVDATPFLNGFAFIARSDDAAYECIDEKGKTIFTLAKDEVPMNAFRQGLCLIEKYEADGISDKYIDEKGNTVYSWKYTNGNFPAPAKNAASKKIDIDKYMEGTKYGYRAAKK